MRQVARRLKDGRLELIEVPDPSPLPGSVLVRIEASVISPGTERATLEVARKGLLAKARARPDQARQVLERARSEGVRSTLALVRQRLEELGPLGYSAAGVAVEVGASARSIAPGDRVAIAGAGFANHAELDVVPSLLCTRVPESVSAEDAAFATLGAIAMHGFRRSGADLGSRVAVIGLGLIGQLAARVASAAGCRVLGIDLEEGLLELARRSGIETIRRSELDGASAWDETADAVLVCASARDNDPVTLAAELARDRATVVIVGDVRIDVPRAPFYEKELDLRLSRSYGPGRYDLDYELHGIDYPLGYVRWTEQRNMQGFLQLVADGKVRPGELVSHRFPIAEAERAFEVLTSERPVAVLLDYGVASDESALPRTRPEPTPPPAAAPRRRSRARPRFGLIGAGRFATATIVPGLMEAGFEPALVASAGGLSAADTARRFGFTAAVSDPDDVIANKDVDLVVIATPHDSHARLTALALATGKPVYVEKPLALDWEGLAAVCAATAASGAPLFVGFNRRHAPIARELRAVSGRRLMEYRVNAGALPLEHWTNDPARGGGRLLGEGCHFIDFLCDQAAADPTSVLARGFPSRHELPLSAIDNFGVQVSFSDGSVGTVSYAADAPAGPGKERFEMSAPGVYAVIEDFRRARVWRNGRQRRLGRGRQDKGFDAQFSLLAAIARGEAEPPPAESFYISTLATLAAARSLETGRPEAVLVPVVENG